MINKENFVKALQNPEYCRVLRIIDAMTNELRAHDPTVTVDSNWQYDDYLGLFQIEIGSQALSDSSIKNCIKPFANYINDSVTKDECFNYTDTRAYYVSLSLKLKEDYDYGPIGGRVLLNVFFS